MFFQINYWENDEMDELKVINMYNEADLTNEVWRSQTDLTCAQQEIFIHSQTLQSITQFFLHIAAITNQFFCYARKLKKASRFLP